MAQPFLWLLFREMVFFPAPMWWLVIVSNCSSRAPSALSRPAQAPGTQGKAPTQINKTLGKATTSKTRRLDTVAVSNSKRMSSSSGLFPTPSRAHQHFLFSFKATEKLRVSGGGRLTTETLLGVCGKVRVRSPECKDGVSTNSPAWGFHLFLLLEFGNKSCVLTSSWIRPTRFHLHSGLLWVLRNTSPPIPSVFRQWVV